MVEVQCYSFSAPYKITARIIMSIKPQDIIADDESYAEINGSKIRKGTMAAALANADIYTSSTANENEKKSSKSNADGIS